MQLALVELLRDVAVWDPFFFPRDRAQATERWLRGRREFRRLRASDCAVVSRGKSGRTWFRIMLSRYFQVRYGLPETDIIGFDNLHRKTPAIPKIFFTHDSCLGDYTGDGVSKSLYRDKKVILLVRDPADTAVSTYFHWKHRMKPSKRILQAGTDDDTMPVFDFVMTSRIGISRIIDFMNQWAAALPQIERSLTLRYEDLRADPAASLTCAVAFLGESVDEAAIAEAVRFASFDNMRAMEKDKTLTKTSRRLVPGDVSNPASFKTRRGKVGGYQDYFDEQQLAEIDRLMRDRLTPGFGYTGSGIGTEIERTG